MGDRPQCQFHRLTRSPVCHECVLAAEVEQLTAELQGKNHTRLDQLECSLALHAETIKRLRETINDYSEAARIDTVTDQMLRSEGMEAAAKIVRDFPHLNDKGIVHAPSRDELVDAILAKTRDSA